MNNFDELQNYDPENGPVVIYKKKGGLFGKIISLLIGLILGIVIALGSIVGVGWYLYAKAPIRNNTGTLNSILGTGFDYSKYISNSYSEQTIQTLVGDVITAVQKVSNGEGSFNTLTAISPLIGDIVLGDGSAADTGLVGLLESYAIYPDRTEIMTKMLVKPSGTPDSPNNKDVYLFDYLKDCVNNASLGDMMKALGYDLNDIVMSLCYGEKGVDYIIDDNGQVQMINVAQKTTLKGFLSDGLDEQIQSLPLDSFLTINFPDDTVMCMLAYGADYRYEQTLDENGEVIMKQVFYEESNHSPLVLIDDEGNDVTANILSGADKPRNGIVLQHTYTQDGKEITETRYLRYNNAENKYLAYEDENYITPIRFKKHTVGMLSEGSDAIIGKMFVKDLMNVDESSERIMISLCYGKENIDWYYDTNGNIQMHEGKKPRTVDDFREGDLFNELTLHDLLGDDVNNNQILKTLADTTLEELPEAMENLTFHDIFADKIYEDEEHTVVQPMWTYLFDDPNTTEEELPSDYYILGQTNDTTADKKGVDTMIDNMQANMQTSTLAKLVRDDLIVFEDDPDTPENEAETEKEEFLTGEQATITINGETKYVRELTIIQLIQWATDPSHM